MIVKMLVANVFLAALLVSSGSASPENDPGERGKIPAPAVGPRQRTVARHAQIMCGGVVERARVPGGILIVGRVRDVHFLGLLSVFGEKCREGLF